MLLRLLPLCAAAQMRKRFATWRFTVHEEVRNAITFSFNFNEGEGAGRRGMWWNDGKFDKDVNKWFKTGVHVFLPSPTSAVLYLGSIGCASQVLSCPQSFRLDTSHLTMSTRHMPIQSLPRNSCTSWCLAHMSCVSCVLT